MRAASFSRPSCEEAAPKKSATFCACRVADAMMTLRSGRTFCTFLSRPNRRSVAKLRSWASSIMTTLRAAVMVSLLSLAESNSWVWLTPNATSFPERGKGRNLWSSNPAAMQSVLSRLLALEVRFSKERFLSILGCSTLGNLQTWCLTCTGSAEGRPSFP